MALIDEKILCMHGGLSPELESLQQIADIQRPCDVPDVGLLCDLLWSDPDANCAVSLLDNWLSMLLCSANKGGASVKQDSLKIFGSSFANILTKQGWGENDRGVSFVFGPDVVHKFLNTHDLDLVVRAHQVVEDGYEFFAGTYGLRCPVFYGFFLVATEHTVPLLYQQHFHIFNRETTCDSLLGPKLLRRIR